MGGKDSKLSYIGYEDAVRRVSEAELKRLKDAFKRASTLSGLMTENLFVREVLWDGVPLKLAQLIYHGFGGSAKGISFKDLLCGLVVLTKGWKEERIKLLFGMYADDSYGFVHRDDIDRKVLETEGQVSTAMSELFKETDQVTFEQFRTWVYLNPDAFIMTRWLLLEPIAVKLSDDTDTPTFYQTLAGVTHLEENDISELEKRYWVLKNQSKMGRLDLETFRSLVCPPVPQVLCEGLFMAFDENCDNHIDFKEMACGISACCRGPIAERQKFCFKVFDRNRDGKLDRAELEEMLSSLMLVRRENKQPDEMESDVFCCLNAGLVTDEILSCHDSDKDGCITMEDYLVWTVNSLLSEDFLDLLSQICHVVLGLRPQTREEEGKIVKLWLKRESHRSLEVNQIWYLISMQWWSTWLDYVSTEISTNNNHNGHRRSSSTDSNSLHRITTKNKGMAATLPWDDQNVIMVNCVPKATDCTLTGDYSKSTTLPKNSNSSNFTKNSLHPVENMASNRSRSPSPKLRKRHMHNTIPQKPGAIDNSQLIVTAPYKVVTLTNEGGRLKRDVMLVRGKDFEMVPEPVWRALFGWYGGSPVLPRTVISSSDAAPELELYPISVRLMRHHMTAQRPVQTTTFTSMVTGIGGMALSMTNFSNNNTTPRRYLAYVAAFSRRHTLQQLFEFLCTKLRLGREDIRLWKVSTKDDQNLTLLDDENQMVEGAGIEDSQQLLIEVRNKDLTWPEEMSQLAKNKTCKKDNVPTQPGATGLNNLGNTCFMNAAVQCVSNTWPLTQYFTGGLHLYELNRTNPLGNKGHIAQRYGELVKDLWSGTSKAIAPLKLRWTIGKYTPRFNGFQQHDCQELLSFLIDGLHEDLNRVHDKPYVELKDSDGRPDEEVAQEAWDNHLLRNQSVIVDLFHGQLKSEVRCQVCGHVSVRFDPFSYLPLPLPMDSCIHLEIIVIRLDGSVPIKYGLRLSMDEKYRALKKELGSLANIPTNQILFVEVTGPIVKTLPQDNQKIRTLLGGTLYAYELPPPEDIPPMTVEEERHTLSAKEKIGLSEIQRGLTTKKVVCSYSQQNGHASQICMSNNATDQNYSATADSPTHSRNSSCASTSPENTLTKSVADTFNGFIIGVHRKMILMDVYFLSSQKTRPSLFGTPLIMPCDEKSTNQDLYQFVWTQVSRLVSPLPPSESKTTNHAQDCDDSMGYEYPFALKVVQKDGFTCAKCPWYRFCRGCRLECDTELFNFGGSFIAIDWEPTTLHLRYQTTLERMCEEHSSVEESRHKQTEPIDLDTCLQAFTTEEELGEEELYYCSKCKKHCLASKKLEIWRLPPILIINLKRFQFLNGRWVKSHKIVKFPLMDFDPTCYLVKPSPEQKSHGNPSMQSTKQNIPNGILPSSNCDKSITVIGNENGVENRNPEENTTKLCTVQTKPMSYPPQSMTATDCQNCADVKYDLYSMACHTGILGGGHYVTYARNPNQNWYCYNDSSCKEVQEDQLDTNSAYILFYERRGIKFRKFMPDITDKDPDTQEIDDEFESDFKKMCVLQ